MKIKILRLKAGFRTQKELATVIGCSREAVSLWEKGKMPSGKMLCKLTQALNCSADELLKQSTLEEK